MRWNLRKKSNTMLVPLTAVAAVVWGALFYVNGLIGRTSPGLRITLALLPYWTWSVLFVGAGVLVFVTLADWAVAVLVGVMLLYAFTLTANAFLTDGATLTGPIWVLLAAVSLAVASARLGVRR